MVYIYVAFSGKNEKWHDIICEHYQFLFVGYKSYSTQL